MPEENSTSEQSQKPPKFQIKISPKLMEYPFIGLLVIYALICGVYIGYYHGFQNSKISEVITRPSVVTTPTPTVVPKTPTPIVKDNCVIRGCNSEICMGASDEEIYSTCVAKPKYTCYRTASCELQANGQCGWTQTEELQSCLSQYQ